MPVFLFIWHKFIQPLVDRWYGKPKLESGKTEEELTSDPDGSLPNGGVKADVSPSKEVTADGRVKSE